MSRSFTHTLNPRSTSSALATSYSSSHAPRSSIVWRGMTYTTAAGGAENGSSTCTAVPGVVRTVTSFEAAVIAGTTIAARGCARAVSTSCDAQRSGTTVSLLQNATYTP